LTAVPLTVDSARETLHDIIAREEASAPISLEKIQEAVARHYHVEISDMKSRRRTDAIAFPRQIAMYLARELTKASLNEIGDAFGGRDHGTVLHACKLVKRRMQEQDNIRQTISFIDSALQR
jgi:chromosomal replication initiator protein